MDRPSKSRGRQSSFKPLAQLRFKTLNELFPSRMHRKDTDDEPIIVEDDAGVERVIRYKFNTLQTAYFHALYDPSPLSPSFFKPNLVPS